jgi:hypothetical protein
MMVAIRNLARNGVVRKGEHIYVRRAWAQQVNHVRRNKNVVIGGDNAVSGTQVVTEVDRQSE